MKIVYFLNARIPTEKAHGYQSLKTAEGFKLECEKVEVVIPFRRQLSKKISVNAFDFYGISSAIKITRIGGIDLIWLCNRFFHGRIRFLTHWAALGNSLMFYLYAVWRVAVESRGTIFYTRDHNLVWFLQCFGWMDLSRNIVVEVHALSSTESRKKRQVSILTKTKGIVCVTNQMKQDLVSRGFPGENAIVCADAVDLKQFTSSLTAKDAKVETGLDVSKRYVAFVGNFQTKGKEKGIPELILAMKPLFEAIPDVGLLLVGDADGNGKRYLSFAEAHGIEASKLKIVDRQPVSELKIWLRAAEVLAMPHPNSEFFARYVSPLKMFEYMASGRPIIGSNLPSIREVLEHDVSALLVSPGDVRALTQAIQLVLEDSRLGYRLALQASAKVRQLTWTARAAQIIEFIHGLR